jgi:phenylpyruvate tautomerase PptA (4-oxalocrotonate tautomerase family)
VPVVTITVRKTAGRALRAKVLDSIHAALVNAGADPKDRFHRVLELDEADFQYDAKFPDVKTARTGEFVLAEILLGAGRSVKIKKKILADIVERLSAHGLDAENLMVVFQDVPWENWSPAGGRMPHG